MPQPAEVARLEEPVLQAYRDAWDRVRRELSTLESDPRKATRAARLRDLLGRIAVILSQADSAAEAFARTVVPRAYAAGVLSLKPLEWSDPHLAAVRQLALDSYSDLLSATEGVRESTKALIRSIARDETLHAVISGSTPGQASRAMVRKLEEEGVYAVVYRDGSKHGLAEYAQVVVRSKMAVAYSSGALNSSPDVTYWEIFDGPECGLSYHQDPTLAAGLVVDRDTAFAFPIAHPNCQRSFGPRPDFVPPQGGVRVTPGPPVDQTEPSRGRRRVLSRLGKRSSRIASRRASRT